MFHFVETGHDKSKSCLFLSRYREIPAADSGVGCSIYPARPSIWPWSIPWRPSLCACALRSSTWTAAWAMTRFVTATFSVRVCMCCFYMMWLFIGVAVCGSSHVVFPARLAYSHRRGEEDEKLFLNPRCVNFCFCSLPSRWWICWNIIRWRINWSSPIIKNSNFADGWPLPRIWRM